jgi:hypothetical protein
MARASLYFPVQLNNENLSLCISHTNTVGSDEFRMLAPITQKTHAVKTQMS